MGHTGAAYGLISSYYYSGDYAVSYAINGALNGYKGFAGSIFELERQMIHSLTYQFITQ